MTIDAVQNTITVCSDRQIQTTSIDNLVQVIEKIAGGNPEHACQHVD